MRVLNVLFLIFLTTYVASANEIFWGTQNVYLKNQRKSGWQYDLMAKINISDKWDVGASGTYLRRFSINDKSWGVFGVYRPYSKLTLEAHYDQGAGNRILPKRQETLTGYFALISGISPYITLKNANYNSSKLQSVTFGTEIEKWKNLILIPQFMLGRSKFDNSSSGQNLHSLGLRVLYYLEEKYSLFGYGYRGKEASEGVVGLPSLRLTTTTFGIGGGYYFTKHFKSDLSFELANYKELDNKFYTTMLNLRYLY